MDYKANRRVLKTFQKPRLLRASFRLLGVMLLLICFLVRPEDGEYAVRESLGWYAFCIVAVWFFIQSFRLGLKAKRSGFVYRGYFVTRRIPYAMVAKFDWGGPDSILVEMIIGSWQEAIEWPVIEKTDGKSIQLKACAMNLISSGVKVDKLNLLFSPNSESMTENVGDQSIK